MREPPNEDIVVAWIKKIMEIPEYIDTMELIQLKEMILCIQKYERKHVISPFRSKLHPDRMYFTKELIKMQIDTLQGSKKWILPIVEEKSKAGFVKPTVNELSSVYFALLHWIKIKTGKAEKFNQNRNGKYSRAEIENYAAKNYSNISPQGFYRCFNEIMKCTQVKTARQFKPGYKQLIAELADNDPDIILYLENYPTLE